MSEKGKAYEHSSRVTGTGSEPDASTEHRESATGNAEERNEIRMDDRREPEGPGPSTHEQTKLDKKKGED